MSFGRDDLFRLRPERANSARIQASVLNYCFTQAAALAATQWILLYIAVRAVQAEECRLGQPAQQPGLKQ